MKVNHDGKVYNIPASISEIKLKQVIGFQLQYGKQSEEFLRNADEDDELDQFEIVVDMACKSVSYFSGIPLEQIYRADINQVLGIYHSVLAPVFQQQEERDLRESYYFNGSLWTIASPDLTFDSKITFNELILGKEITKDLKNFAAGKFDALLRLAVIYFRKVDESFDEEWLQEGSERLELMANLPMDIVLDVAFFLQSSMSAFLQSSQFSESLEAEKAQT